MLGDGRESGGYGGPGGDGWQPNYDEMGLTAVPPALSNVNVGQAALTEKEKERQQYHSGGHEDQAIPPGRWPVVLFKNGKKMLLPPMSFALSNADGVDEATRVQVPLILAWA